jgi:hypothetical protein
MIEALSVNVGEKVLLSYSDLSDDSATVAIVNDNTVEVTLRGFAYHISASDFADFVVTQVKMSREIGC